MFPYSCITLLLILFRLHVALTYNPVTMEFTIYHNGALLLTNGGQIIKPRSQPAFTKPWIGRSQWASDPYLNAYISDYRFYNVTLR